MQAQPSRMVFKITVLGDGGVGKTALTVQVGHSSLTRRGRLSGTSTSALGRRHAMPRAPRQRCSYPLACCASPRPLPDADSHPAVHNVILCRDVRPHNRRLLPQAMGRRRPALSPRSARYSRTRCVLRLLRLPAVCCLCGRGGGECVCAIVAMAVAGARSSSWPVPLPSHPATERAVHHLAAQAARGRAGGWQRRPDKLKGSSLFIRESGEWHIHAGERRVLRPAGI